MQSILPLEVIVVDNNSTDATREIAAAYSFVTVISEPRQGVVHARNTGFTAARGDIIGRIDADTRLSENWVQRIASIFEQDSKVAAVAGNVDYHNLAYASLVNTIDTYVRRYFHVTMRREIPLQGANMAVRRSAWHKIAREVCSRPGMHEDFDLSIHLHTHNAIIRYDESVLASVAYRQAAGSWAQFARYGLLAPKTYQLHGRKSGRWLYIPIGLGLIIYPILHLLSKGKNPKTGGFSVSKFVNSHTKRVNPALFVD